MSCLYCQNKMYSCSIALGNIFFSLGCFTFMYWNMWERKDVWWQPHLLSSAFKLVICIGKEKQLQFSDTSFLLKIIYLKSAINFSEATSNRGNLQQNNRRILAELGPWNYFFFKKSTTQLKEIFIPDKLISLQCILLC